VMSIGGRAFYECISLANIHIPSSVASIEVQAFNECTSLTSITFEGTKEQWNAISKGSGWNDFTAYTITYNYTGE
jgi:hypothetical protein